MNTLLKIWQAMLLSFLTIAVLLNNQAAAQIADIQTDGWHTWQIPAVPGAPEMCCFSWRSGSISHRHCDLDGRNGGFSSSDDSAGNGEHVQVYALLKAGLVSKIRALSSSCPVTADSAITDLGPIDADLSVDWLEPVISGGGRNSSSAIAAIAVHEGNRARDILIDIATHYTDRDDREEAIFWMGQARIGETAAVIRKILFDDEDADIREHAAFAYSQSTAADVAEVLIQQGRNDADPDVRSQAWFWLAETGADESEAEIRNALENDSDEDVREEAVFALSQLPEERAIRAFVQIVEDQKMDREVREQALFWLAQTESEEAFSYIDKLLGSN